MVLKALSVRAWFGLALLLCVHGSPTRADAGGESEQYRALIDGALEEYQLAHYQEAMALFERAHLISPSARTLRGMGLASYQARRYVQALGLLRAALDDKRRALTPVMRREVLAALEASQSFIASFELRVEPEDAIVTVDGEPFAWNRGTPLLLDPGEHQVVAMAPGHQNDSRHISSTPGHNGRIEIRLQSLAAEVTAPAEAVVAASQPVVEPTEAAPKAESPAPMSVKVLTFTGASVALLGGVLGTVAGVKAIQQEDQLAQSCPDKQCAPDQAGDLDDAKRWGNLSTAALAVGGAGMIVAVVGGVLWRRHAKRDAQHSRAAARLTPLLGAGLGVRGAF